MLAQHGIARDTAGNGEIALRKLATRAVRGLPGMAGLKIVAMSANAMEGNRERMPQGRHERAQRKTRLGEAAGSPAAPAAGTGATRR